MTVQARDGKTWCVEKDFVVLAKTTDNRIDIPPFCTGSGQSGMLRYTQITNFALHQEKP